MNRLNRWWNGTAHGVLLRTAAWLLVIAIGALGFRSGHQADQHLREYVDDARARACESAKMADERDHERWLALIARGATSEQRERITKVINDTFKNLPPPGACQKVEVP